MAKLDVLQRQPEKIILGKGGSKNFGNLIGLLIFGVVACVGMSAFLEEGFMGNPVLLVIGIIVAVAVFSSALGTLRATRVVIDNQQRLATREDSVLFLPVRLQSMALNTIRDVNVSAPRLRNTSLRTTFPVWQVDLRAADGSVLVVNDRGVHDEMRALADEVGALLNRPVRDTVGEPAPASVSARSTPEAPYRRASARQARQQAAAAAPIAATTARQASQQTAANETFQQTSARLQSQGAAANAPILETSVLFESEGAAAMAPVLQTSVLQAYDQTVAGAPIAAAAAQQAQAQTMAGMPVFEMGMRMAFSQMSAFESDAAIRAQMVNASAAAGVPFAESSARLAQQQSQATYTVEYALPPAAGMGQMSALASFPPMMDLPALEPIGFDAMMLNLGSMLFPEARDETRDAVIEPETIVEGAARSVSDETAAQLQTARQWQRQGNFDAAKQAYENALDADPGSVEIHNDLGVLFFSKSKLQEAERAFRQTIALDPFYAPGRYNLGVTLQRLGKRKAATEQFRLGAQNAYEYAQDFQNALQGNLHAPILSA